ncbi:MAG: hypothetical protein ACRC8S_00970 [Fimbriiglobus sp.]
MPATVKSLEERLEGMLDDQLDTKSQLTKIAEDFAVFRAKMETTITMVRWIGVTVAAIAVTIGLQLYSVAHQAGKLEATVGHIEKNLQDQKQTIAKHTESMEDQKQSIMKLTTTLEVTVERLQQTIQKSETHRDEQTKALRDITKELAEVKNKLK